MISMAMPPLGTKEIHLGATLVPTPRSCPPLGRSSYLHNCPATGAPVTSITMPPQRHCRRELLPTPDALSQGTIRKSTTVISQHPVALHDCTASGSSVAVLFVTSRLWDAPKERAPSGANVNSSPESSRGLFALTRPRNTLPGGTPEPLSNAHRFGCLPLRVGSGFARLKFPELFLLSARAEHLSSLPVGLGGPLGVVSAAARKTSCFGREHSGEKCLTPVRLQ